MNVVLGDAAVSIVFAASLVCLAAFLYSLLGKKPEYSRLAFQLGWIIPIGAVVAFAALERALITRDFTVEFVFNNGSHKTPALFNFATAWASLAGSILLWGLVLGGYLALMLHRYRSRSSDPLVAWAMVVMMAVVAFFFGIMLGPADPFVSVIPPPGFLDGPGPNPLLQNDVMMAIHPPLLYLGYVGFTVPFAFAIAALITGRVGEGWLVETRRWTLCAYGFLTLGILFGAWWSYDVLGWGGYWGWDPVENASLLPWLTGTAYLHSVMIQERRGMLRVWNLSLLCATFSLTILGTFLTRSGVVESVHAFTEGAIGPLFLGFFTLCAAASLFLIGWRGDELRTGGRIDSRVSRESAFLANNIVFSIFAFVVLLGTVFPLIVEATRDERISVGVPYFERMTMPLGITILFLMAVAPVLRWGGGSLATLARRLETPAWVGTASVVLAVAVGARGFVPLLAFGLAGFAGAAAMRQVGRSGYRRGLRGLIGRTNGGMIVHIGVIILAVGLASSNSYLKQTEIAIAPTERVEYQGHQFEFSHLSDYDEGNRIVVAAHMVADGEAIAPTINRYKQGMTVPTPATFGDWTKDTQVALVSLPASEGEDIVVRITIQPMIRWLWTGGLLMGLGTALAAMKQVATKTKSTFKGAKGAVEQSSNDTPKRDAEPNIERVTVDHEQLESASETIGEVTL